MEVLIESFSLYDKNGRKYPAQIFEDRLDVSSSSGRGSISGLRTCKLGDGRLLNYKDENTFEIVENGVMLTRSQP